VSRPNGQLRYTMYVHYFANVKAHRPTIITLALAMLCAGFGVTPATSTSAATSSAAPISCASGITDGHLERLAGANRFETAISVSLERFTSGTAEAGIIARADNFADALVAGPVARKLNATLLLASPTGLSSTVVAELMRALPTDKPVYLIGGTAALSDTVRAQVAGLGYQDVRRVAGATRYETATEAAALFSPTPTHMAVARGDTFADALALGGAAAERQIPLLLTRPDAVPKAVLDYIPEHPSLDLVILAGGSVAISDQAESQIEALLPGSVERYGGQDRYETSVALMLGLYSSPCAVSLVTGQNFPDALVAAAHSGERESAILLVRPNEVPVSVQAALEANEATITGGFVYGGTAAIDQHTLVSAQAMIEPASFVFWGDGGHDNSHWHNNAAVISDLVATQDVDGLFMLGDNIYPSGAADASDPAFATLYENPLASVITDHEINVILGNHDVVTANGQGELDYAMTHPYWYQPGHYYARTLEHVRVVALDTNQAAVDQTQLDFLAEQANGDANALTTIVLGHHPVYSSGLHGLADDEPWMLELVQPVLAAQDVEFFLSGHDHDFEALLPHDGVNQIVSGGGSAVRSITPSADTIEALSEYHTSKLDVFYSHADLTVYGEDGSVLFTHRYQL